MDLLTAGNNQRLSLFQVRSIKKTNEAGEKCVGYSGVVSKAGVSGLVADLQGVVLCTSKTLLLNGMPRVARSS